VVQRSSGGPDTLEIGEVPAPIPGPLEVLVDVAATAVNRADLLQRQGLYPPPPGTTNVLGLECSGTVVEVGSDVTGWRPGEEVCALLAGGGYAEQVAVPAGQLMPIPDGVSLIDAAALPEVTCTVWSMIFMHSRLAEGETLLAHGGASGIGTMAVQLGKALGASVFVTVGSAAKAEACLSLGADAAIDYSTQDFVEETKRLTTGRGADVIADIIGAKYLARNVDALAADGRIAIIGMQGGMRGELDIGRLMAKRATIYSAGLRARPLEQKADIVFSVVKSVWPLVAQRRVRPVIDRVLPMDRAGDAHRAVEASGHIGKVLIAVR
jgi:putative PIG3 family NAD(P)H quinone oxidoreductase